MASGVATLGDKLLALNVYPGVMPGRFRDLGAWMTAERGGAVSLGLTSGVSLGLGLGLDVRRDPGYLTGLPR